MSNYSNSTSAVESTKIWTFIPSYSLAVLLAAILTNGSVLYLFLRHSHLRTAFTVYLINLLAASLLAQLIQVPLYLVANLRPYWWIGRSACTIYIYGFFIQAGMCNAHALISINRLWAVLRPISYRRLHTKRTAWIICGIMWLYIHAITLPGFIADALYYRLPEERHGCFLNKGPQPGWAYTHQFMVFSLPVMLVGLAYPVICCKTWKRSVSGRSIQPLSVRGETTEGDGMAVPVAAVHSVPSVGQSVAQRQSRSFWVLTIVTVSMLILWLPSIVFYTAMMFQDVSGWVGVSEAATVLLFLESVTDPIMFTLALKDLRIAFVKSFVM
ncbi:hypothetical protein BV898_08326 [Hypsibius exemplaris]|uniref:G-protein coupled receptors family 1 profile domain-containing protein n=1 Tax=Hypsibius exemplaris TaxID=2072580 RepID=A0A1W0WQS5_HYPEX|nr:hypothetical protein BV898_08326 [Hypsibius exemplaris]